jgi:apolipoprotein N-acyltransferase
VFGREFAELVAASEPQPNVLVNVSNLAWFGKSRAMEQHAQMSRTRALELGRPMIRATNTGLSGVIGAEGQWLLRLSTNEPEIGLVSVPVTRGLTFYARHPDALWRAALVLTACWLLLAVWLAKRRARYNSTLAAIPPRPPADYHET